MEEQGVESQGTKEKRVGTICFCPGLKQGVNEAIREKFEAIGIRVYPEYSDTGTMPVILADGHIYRGLLQIQDFFTNKIQHAA